MNGKNLKRLKMVKFTERELEIIKLLCLEAKEIGGRLGLTPATVRTHIQHIMQKTGASTRSGCLIELIRAGITNIEDVVTN
jgi:DNA-binding NarL/FixJ family response regulator